MSQFYKYLQQYSQVVLHIALILILAWIARRLARRAIRMLKAYLGSQAENNPEELKRIETLGQVFHYIASVVIVVVAGMLLLGETNMPRRASRGGGEFCRHLRPHARRGGWKTR